MVAARTLTVTAHWDEQARQWWAHNDEIPLTTEAATFDALVERVLAIAPEIMELNGVAAPGEAVTIEVTAVRSHEVSLPAA